MVRRCLLVFVLALALGFTVAALAVTVPPQLGAKATTAPAPARSGHDAQVTLNRDRAALTAALSNSLSPAGSSDLRRFDPPLAAVAAAAMLVVACQWLSAHRRRSRVVAPLTTR